MPSGSYKGDRGACQAGDDGGGGMQERVVGQADAVSAVSRAMRRARSGLKDPRRPIAAMLFAASARPSSPRCLPRPSALL